MLEIVSARQQPQELHRMCSVAETDKKNRAKDNYSTDWQDKPHTLLWKFYNGMYKPCVGDYYLLYSESGKLMGGAGFYVYDKRYVLGMTRFYVMPGFERQWIGRHMLAKQMVKAKEMAPRMLITFNDYNKKIYDIYVNHIDKLPPIWSAFKPIGQMEINHCMQYCCEAVL
jgi:GNAT superfamily N-acetyltransferase